MDTPAANHAVQNRVSVGPNRRFPAGFEWGIATSAFQIEGAMAVHGRGPSIWDEYAVASGAAPGLEPVSACDHYHRFRDDIALMRDMGIRHYRLSLSWPRILPTGEGAVNESGAAFYDRLIDALLEAGITPALTMYHWELPQHLEVKYGGWRSRETAKRLGDFAAWAGLRYGDRVKRFFTTNEFYCFTDRAYAQGEFPPRLRVDNRERNQIRHHGLLGHGYALQGLRATVPGVRAGVVEDARPFVPVIETEEHIAAARHAFRRANAHFLTAIMEGGYCAEYLRDEGDDAPQVEDGDFAIISAPTDFLGLNLYTAEYVMAADNEQGFEIVDKPARYPHMHAEWIRVVPPVTYWAPRLCHELWGARSLYVAESGCGGEDRADTHGRILDVDRVFYLREHLTYLHRAVAEGFPVRGIYLWSLMDNFEWLDGLKMRFGLVHVDFATQERRPKLSANFYAEVIRQNGLV